jgi:glycosyltransferase involved in cell wall biosynthesis
VGQFDCYERYCQQIPGFEESFVHLGFQEDILAVLECCDLYLNPPRVGGGSSVAEALYKQKPVVTLNKGDGAVTAGQAFVVEDDELLVETICRYKEDAAFYFAQQQEAEQRAALLTNSDKAFAEVIQLAFLNTLFDLPWQVPTKS